VKQQQPVRRRHYKVAECMAIVRQIIQEARQQRKAQAEKAKVGDGKS